MSRGLYLVLSGDSLDAGQAQQAGLTIKVVPPGLRPILRARASRVLRGRGRSAGWRRFLTIFIPAIRRRP
jgi:enoyl-CoA hydratase/carnithine racemase